MSTLEQNAARVVVPVLDLRPSADAAASWSGARELARRGVGGFILFGGEAATLAAELAELRAQAPGPLLIGSDLERGVGQQVVGCSSLPPLSALGAADDPELARAAGEALAHEALALGIDWIYAPVLDLADEPRNPIVGGRAFAAEPERVATLGRAFVEGLQGAGALACAKHYPGHGPTLLDSHEADPVVERSGQELRARDLAPFRAVADAVASVMSAHVAYPTLTGDDLPATRSPQLLGELLRGELGFAGAVVSDALIMDGVRAGGLSEQEAACAALAAGCDLLLYPSEPAALIEALVRWAGEAPERAARLAEAAGRAEALAARAAAPQRELAAATAAGRALEERICAAALARRGSAQAPLAAGQEVALLILDDDEAPTLGNALAAELRAAGVALRVAGVDGREASDPARWREAAASCARRVVAVGCQVRAWKGRPGLAPELGRLLAELEPAGLSVVGLCGAAPLREAPAGAELLLAHGAAPAAERAAARVLLGADAPGRWPT